MGKNKNRNKKKKDKKRKNGIYNYSLIIKAKNGAVKAIKMENQHQNESKKAENVIKLDPNEYENNQTEQEQVK